MCVDFSLCKKSQKSQMLVVILQNERGGSGLIYITQHAFKGFPQKADVARSAEQAAAEGLVAKGLRGTS